ncbi:MAG: hypothetical protein JXJ22_06780 [Bacteroidales bacterium]|nr:hypothetical protein [Bacteroidales bacterium]
MNKGGLSPARNINHKKIAENKLMLTWDTAYAGDNPLSHYEILKNGIMAGKVMHSPQTTLKPFEFTDIIDGNSNAEYKIITIDSKGFKAEKDIIKVI